MMKKTGLIFLLFALSFSILYATTESEVIGSWNCKTDTEETVEFQLTFFEKNGHLYGTYKTEKQELPLHYIRILDDQLRFQVETRGLKIKYRSTIEGNGIEGTISAENLAVEFTGTRAEPEQGQ